MSKLPIEFRPMSSTDESFVYSTWLKSYRHSNFAADMSNDVFFSYHKEIVAKILSESTVTMLVNQEDPNQIYGYGVQQKIGDRSITHFVYIKYNFRKFGLATAIVDHMDLFPDTTNFITHLPRNYATKFKAKYGLEYNPYLLGETLG